MSTFDFFGTYPSISRVTRMVAAQTGHHWHTEDIVLVVEKLRNEEFHAGAGTQLADWQATVTVLSFMVQSKTEMGKLARLCKNIVEAGEETLENLASIFPSDPEAGNERLSWISDAVEAEHDTPLIIIRQVYVLETAEPAYHKGSLLFEVIHSEYDGKGTPAQWSLITDDYLRQNYGAENGRPLKVLVQGSVRKYKKALLDYFND